MSGCALAVPPELITAAAVAVLAASISVSAFCLAYVARVVGQWWGWRR